MQSAANVITVFSQDYNSCINEMFNKKENKQAETSNINI